MGISRETPAEIAASAQLELELLNATFQHNGQVPILTHLNADTTWLLQIPYPDTVLRDLGRIYYNILLDPRLGTPQTEIGGWFSSAWHTSTESRWRTIAEVEELIGEREDDVVVGRTGRPKKKVRRPKGRKKSLIDAVIVSHEGGGHCHKETLLEVDADVPVFATKKAAALINSWMHFTTVQEIPLFTASKTDWRDTTIDPLPYWMSVSQVAWAHETTRSPCPAILITFQFKEERPGAGDDDDDDGANNAVQGLVYTTHSISPSELKLIATACPPIETVALLHGFHNVTASGRFWPWAKPDLLNVHNVLEAQSLLKAKYWIGTSSDDNEVNKNGGIMEYFFSRKVVTVKEAVLEGLDDRRWRRRRRQQQQKSTFANGFGSVADQDDEEHEEDLIQDVAFVELDNGESIALE